MKSIWNLNVLAIIFTSILLNGCMKNQNTNDFRDVYTGDWKFNGKRTRIIDTDSGEYTYNDNISNYVGAISKPSWPDSEAYPNRIIINYMNGSSQKFDIDSVGNIFNYIGGNKLGTITNQNSITLNWQSESDGTGSSSTITTVNLTAVKQ
jgi:hypothetical protein